MKKKIWIPLLVIVVLVVVWLGATWYSGKQLQGQINDGIAQLNANGAKLDPDLQLQIKPVSYERGLFSTHARYMLTSGAAPVDLEQDPVIDVVIWHGPFPRGLLFKKFALHAELPPTGAMKSLADAWMKGKAPLVIDANCSYGGHWAGTGSVPAIDVAKSDDFKLLLGGVQMQFDGVWHTETDYAINGSAQFLPVSVNGQNFGSGQMTAAADAQHVNGMLSWKTDQGESKLSGALALTRTVTRAEAMAVKKKDLVPWLRKLVKTASLNVALSKAMIVDLGVRLDSLGNEKGGDVTAKRQQMSAQLDQSLSADSLKPYIRIQGDTIASDWQYADGKFTLNGQENPAIQARLKQVFQMMGPEDEDDPASSGEGQ